MCLITNPTDTDNGPRRAVPNHSYNTVTVHPLRPALFTNSTSTSTSANTITAHDTTPTVQLPNTKRTRTNHLGALRNNIE